jgi:hypothetical protein
MTNGSLLIATICLLFPCAYGQSQPALSVQEEAISAQIIRLRELTHEVWTQTVGKIARQIQQLPAGEAKESLIGDFGNLVTEGDAGHETLQVVASTMAQVLRDSPNSPVSSTLAQLVRYEHVEISSDNPYYLAALKELEEQDLRRQNPEFTLRDLRASNGVSGSCAAKWCW